MTDEKTSDILDKYTRLKDERDALKVQLDAITANNEKLVKDYETSKAEIGNLQKIIMKHVVSTEPDKTDDKKVKTLRDIFMDEYEKIERNDING